MSPPPPVQAAGLFPELAGHLVQLLRGLSDEEWRRPTACPGWSVKDVALHLLGDELGNLSRRRDGSVDTSLVRPGEDLSRWDDLVAFINRYNEVWVAATRRLSTPQVCDLLELASGQASDYFQSLDPSAVGEPVSWAGPEPAAVWLDIAREYTERWLHQQQIREAVGRPPLTEARLLRPVLQTFVRALPRAFRGVAAAEGACVCLTISGEAGGRWYVVRRVDAWTLADAADGEPSASVAMDEDTAWRLFTKGILRGNAMARAEMAGDRSLARRVFDAVAIIA